MTVLVVLVLTTLSLLVNTVAFVFVVVAMSHVNGSVPLPPTASIQTAVSVIPPISTPLPTATAVSPTPTAVVEQGDVLPAPRPKGGGVLNITPTPPANVPIRASYYTLEPVAGLNDATNVNCDDDCSHMALVRFDPAFYGRAAACPVEWLGLHKTARLTINGLGVVHCLDAGTAIKLTYRKVSGYGDEPLWVYEVDFLCRTEPVFHGRLYEEWQIAWVPLEEAIAAAQMGETIC